MHLFLFFFSSHFSILNWWKKQCQSLLCLWQIKRPFVLMWCTLQLIYVRRTDSNVCTAADYTHWLMRVACVCIYEYVCTHVRVWLYSCVWVSVRTNICALCGVLWLGTQWGIFHLQLLVLLFVGVKLASLIIHNTTAQILEWEKLERKQCSIWNIYYYC